MLQHCNHCNILAYFNLRHVLRPTNVSSRGFGRWGIRSYLGF